MMVLFSMLISMIKIGCFAFGGGYAIISLLENEFVKKRGWVDYDEFMDIVAIAESTPGPIAINVATYIGYKQKGLLGATLATVGMCLPSFVIMYIITLVYDKLMAITLVAAAFRGIQIGVVYLIISSGIKMLKKMKKTPLNIAVFSLSFFGMTAVTLFELRLSSVCFILFAGLLGLALFFAKQKGRSKEQ